MAGVFGGGSEKESTVGIKVATEALLRIGSAAESGQSGRTWEFLDRRGVAVEEPALLFSLQQGVVFS